MRYLRNLISAALFVLGVLAPAVTPVAAATVLPTDAPPYDLVVTATGGGPFNGQTASGAIFWDASLLTGSGYETMSRSGANGTIADAILGLFIDVPGFTFTEADDLDEPFFTFLDGNLQTISYIVADISTTVDLAFFGVDLFTFDTTSPVGFDGQTVSVNAIVKYLAPVPLPAGLPLLAGGLGLLWLARRRRLA